VYNVSAVQSGELEFGIIQSDVAFAAYNGKGAWANKPFGGLRSVLGLHSELVTIIARSGAGIREVADLAGKRINVGEARSGTRATWALIEAALGWDEAHRPRLTQLRPDETARALCTGEIDANLQIVGHPSDAVRDQLSACDANLVPITGPIVDKLLNTEPYYHRGSISGDSYGLPGDVPSFGVRAVLMTSASMDPRVVSVLAHAVITHITEFQRLHPVLECLTAKEMIGGELPAPLHPGAIQAYKELGLLK
jgi:TRAP transporter TAXI family solute receptor